MGRVITATPRSTTESGEAHGPWHAQAPATVDDRWAHQDGDESGGVHNKSNPKQTGLGSAGGAATHPVSLTPRPPVRR